MLIAIVLGVVIGGGAAFALRARLNSLAFLTWIGWLLVGTGLPVLAGQSVFLVLAGGTGEGESALPFFALVAGFCAGLGWAAIAAGLRLTRRPG